MPDGRQYIDQQAQFAAPSPAPAASGGGFAGILQSLLGGGQAPAAAPAAQAPAVDPTASLSSGAPAPVNPQAAVINRYSPLTDPEGPLAHAGWIGALLAQGPSKTDYLNAVAQQQQTALGQSRTKAFQELAGLVAGGSTPQQAFLKFMNTPAGVDFITKDPNPQEAIQSFMKLAGPDPNLQIAGNRQAAQGSVFGAPAAPGAPAPAAVQGTPGPAVPGLNNAQQASQMLPTGAAGPVAPSGAVPVTDPTAAVAPNAAGGTAPAVTAQAAPQDPKQDPQKWLQLATVLQTGDKSKGIAPDAEGAKNALEMAKSLMDLQNGEETPDIKEYNLVVQQAQKAGKTPPQFSDWLMSTKSAGASKQTMINTPEGFDAKRKGAMLAVDQDYYQKTLAPQANSARGMLNTLDVVEQFSDAPHGLAGATAAQLAQWSDILGIQVTPQMEKAQVLQALTAKMSAAFRPVGTGSTSDYEQKLFQSAVPGLMQDPGARKMMITINRAFAQRAIDQAALYRKNLGADDLDDKLAELDNKSILTDDQKKYLEKLAPSQPPAGATDSGDFSKTNAPAELPPPKTGDTAVGPNGKVLTFTNGTGWK